MRKKVVKKLESMMPDGTTVKQFRQAKDIYKGTSQQPKLKISKRQKRLTNGK